MHEAHKEEKIMKNKVLAMIMAGALSAVVLAGCGEAPAETEETVAEETVEEGAEEAPAEEEVVEEGAEEAPAEEGAAEEGTEEAAEVAYVDGYYANDGNGSDFMIFFYDANGTDVAYVNDGTAEAFSEYTAETAQTEDGTEYVLVTVGGLQLGYLVADDGSVCIIDNSGNVYAASALTEEEANALYTVVTE